MDYKGLQRIIENENTVKELEMLVSRFRSELNSCRDPSVDNKDSRKYGIDRGSLISSALSMFHELKIKENGQGSKASEE